MSRLRQRFIILNLNQDAEDEHKDKLEDRWHFLRGMQAAMSNQPNTKYEEILSRLENSENDPQTPADELDKFIVWRMSNPMWIDFQLSKEEYTKLSESKLRGKIN